MQEKWNVLLQITKLNDRQLASFMQLLLVLIFGFIAYWSFNAYRDSHARAYNQLNELYKDCQTERNTFRIENHELYKENDNLRRYPFGRYDSIIKMNQKIINQKLKK